MLDHAEAVVEGRWRGSARAATRPSRRSAPPGSRSTTPRATLYLWVPLPEGLEVGGLRAGGAGGGGRGGDGGQRVRGVGRGILPRRAHGGRGTARRSRRAHGTGACAERRRSRCRRGALAPLVARRLGAGALRGDHRAGRVQHVVASRALARRTPAARLVAVGAAAAADRAVRALGRPGAARPRRGQRREPDAEPRGRGRGAGDPGAGGAGGGQRHAAAAARGRRPRHRDGGHARRAWRARRARRHELHAAARRRQSVGGRGHRRGEHGFARDPARLRRGGADAAAGRFDGEEPAPRRQRQPVRVEAVDLPRRRQDLRHRREGHPPGRHHDPDGRPGLPLHAAGQHRPGAGEPGLHGHAGGPAPSGRRAQTMEDFREAVKELRARKEKEHEEQHPPPPPPSSPQPSSPQPAQP